VPQLLKADVKSASSYIPDTYGLQNNSQRLPVILKTVNRSDDFMAQIEGEKPKTSHKWLISNRLRQKNQGVDDCKLF
jgi:hypothetical protein